MPPGSEAAKRKMAAAAGATDRLGALSTKVLHRVLSFLPSSEAVRTCLLARRWRDVWKGARGLRVNGSDGYDTAGDMNKFVNSLVLLRDDTKSVDVLEIDTYRGNYSDGAFWYLELWIRYALSCEAQVICLRNNTTGQDRWCMPFWFITSIHLRVLELDNLQIEVSNLDFTSCPALENLRMEECDIDQTTRILSHSVKRLTMKSCHFNYGIRTLISAPNLIFMELADSWGYTPQLQNMPLLASAFVRLMIDKGCEVIEDSAYVLLGGLSNATNLELVSLQKEPILRKDLTWCPVFSNLKTLLLGDWCVTDDLHALICFIQHSPILEKLTLQFSKKLKDLVEEGASYDVKEPFALDHLTVEVKCHNADDKRIRRILDRLKLYGVPPEKIKIRQPPKLIKSRSWPDASFSFEQEETSSAVDADASSHSPDAASSVPISVRAGFSFEQEGTSSVVYAAASTESPDAATSDSPDAASSDTDSPDAGSSDSLSESPDAASSDGPDAASSECSDYMD